MPTIPNDEQFVGISSSEDLIERGSAQTNSARTIYTYAPKPIVQEQSIHMLTLRKAHSPL